MSILRDPWSGDHTDPRAVAAVARSGNTLEAMLAPPAPGDGEVLEWTLGYLAGDYWRRVEEAMRIGELEYDSWEFSP